jgi:hypothetical protein
MFWESLRNATAVSVDQPAILPVWRGPVQKLAFQHVSTTGRALCRAQI